MTTSSPKGCFFFAVLLRFLHLYAVFCFLDCIFEPLSKAITKGGYQSGQMGQTVTLLSQDFEGSNPSPPTPAGKFYFPIFHTLHLNIKHQQLHCKMTASTLVAGKYGGLHHNLFNVFIGYNNQLNPVCPHKNLV